MHFDIRRSSKLKSVYAYKSLKSFFKKDFFLKLRTFAIFAKPIFKKKNEIFRFFGKLYVKRHTELEKDAIFKIRKTIHIQLFCFFATKKLWFPPRWISAFLWTPSWTPLKISPVASRPNFWGVKKSWISAFQKAEFQLSLWTPRGPLRECLLLRIGPTFRFFEELNFSFL